MIHFFLLSLIFLVAWFLQKAHAPFFTSFFEIKQLAITRQSLRLYNWRKNLLLFCFAPVALIFTGAVTSGLFNISSLYLVTFSVGLFVVLKCLIKWIKTSRFLFYAQGFVFLALIYFVIENSLRALATLQNTSSLVLSFAENRPVFLVLYAFLALLFTLVLRWRFWSVAFALFTLALGWSSISFCVVLFLGESLGEAILSYVKNRQQKNIPPVLLLTRTYVVILAISLPLQILVLGYLRDFLAASYFSLAPQDLILAYWLHLAALMIIPTVIFFF